MLQSCKHETRIILKSLISHIFYHHRDFPYFENSHFISNAIIEAHNKKIYSPRLVCAKKIFFQLFLCAGAECVSRTMNQKRLTISRNEESEREREEREKNLLAAAAAELAMVLLWNIRKTLFGSDNFFVLGSSQPFCFCKKKIKCERTETMRWREKKIFLIRL